MISDQRIVQRLVYGQPDPEVDEMLEELIGLEPYFGPSVWIVGAVLGLFAIGYVLLGWLW